MRRLQVNEAMNYAEKRGWTYNLVWSIETQYQMTFGNLSEVAEIMELLEEKEMPIDPSKLSPGGNTIL